MEIEKEEVMAGVAGAGAIILGTSTVISLAAAVGASVITS